MNVFVQGKIKKKIYLLGIFLDQDEFIKAKLNLSDEFTQHIVNDFSSFESTYENNEKLTKLVLLTADVPYILSWIFNDI